MGTLPTRTLRPVLDRLAGPDPAADADALIRFARHRDGAAFAHLVRRFGPLVLGVCRRVLGSRPEADDCYQATFWALARRAGSVRDPRTLPGWLHAVALRTARRAQRRLRPVVEPLADRPAPDDPFADASWRELRQRLDEEVRRLPTKLRLPILLCHFEELTRDEAAARLGWSLSTFRRRLETARSRLRLRLLRRGIVPGLLGAATLLSDRLTARVPATLETTTVGFLQQTPPAAVRALVPTGPGLKMWLIAAIAVAGLGWGIALQSGPTTPPAAKDPPPKDAPPAEAAKDGTIAETLPPNAVARIGTTRYRAGQAFWFGSFSKDGRWFVSGTEGVELWDLNTGLRHQVMPVRNNTVPRPRLSPDGKLIAVLDGGPGVHLFDRATGKELLTLGKEMFEECRFTPDGKRLVAERFRDTPVVKGFDLDGKELFSRPPAGDQIGEWDGRLVSYAIGTGAGKPGPITVRVVEVETGKELKTFETATADYYVEPEENNFRTGIRDSTLSRNRIAVAPDLSCVAYLRADLGLGIVALAGGAKPQAVGLPKDWRPSRIWFSPDGNNLFATNWGGAIARIDPATGKLIATFHGHNNGVGQWHFDPAGKVMTTTGQDGLIARWDLTTNKEIPLATGGFKSAVRAVFAGNRVVVGDRAGNIDVYDTAGKLLHELPRRADGGDWYTFAVAPDNRTLVTTRPEGVILWWDLVAAKELATMKLPGPVPDQMFRSVQHIGFTPDGRQLVCSKQDGNLFAIDVPARKVLWEIGPPTDKDYDAAVTMAVSADGRVAARGLRRGVKTGAWGYGLQIVEVATGRPVNIIDVSETKGPHGLPDLGDVHYTADGRFLVLASRNGHVQVRHADTLAEVSSWMADSRHALTMNVSPDGRTVLTGDDTGAVKLWELLTGKLLASVAGHRAYVDSVAASADGRFLVTGGHDQVAYVWNLKPAAPSAAKAVERLTGDDAAAAREAVWALAADPDGPARLRQRINPANDPKAETIRGWIADLDDPGFAKREAAMAELAKAGVLAEPAIRKALAGTPTPEARERLNKVLAGIDHKPTRADIFHARAVHALELANTDAARKLLTEWAAGPDGAWLTIDARLALKRLGGQK